LNLVQSSALLQMMQAAGVQDDEVEAEEADRASTASAASTGASGKITQPTVCNQFKRQLHGLIQIVNSSHPHFVRCVKSNDDKKPATFTAARVAQQVGTLINHCCTICLLINPCYMWPNSSLINRCYPTAPLLYAH
jgi:myosin heavy subunit